MMIFNALFSAWAALAAPEQPVEELADEVTAADDVSADDVEFTDEVDPDEARWWRCYDRPHSRGYCLARCEGSHRFRRVTDEVRVRGDRGLCERRARRYCRGRGGVDDVCFGGRD
jgi:hypothetical protein